MFETLNKNGQTFSRCARDNQAFEFELHLALGWLLFIKILFRGHAYADLGITHRNYGILMNTKWKTWNMNIMLVFIRCDWKIWYMIKILQLYYGKDTRTSIRLPHSL